MKRLFDNTFTKENITNSWIAVGFLPMTANAVNDTKVLFELGEDGAWEAEQKRMRDLHSDYCATREELAQFHTIVHTSICTKKPRIVKKDVIGLPRGDSMVQVLF